MSRAELPRHQAGPASVAPAQSPLTWLALEVLASGARREIKDLDKQIAAAFRRHRHAHIIESVPGSEPVWAQSS